MTVIYRMCGIPSTNPSPIYQDDKYSLNKLCLKSFVQAYSDVQPKVHFLLDHCGVEYYKMLEDTVPFNYEVDKTDIGINATMLCSYDLASWVDDIVVFQECDYLYHGVVGNVMNQAISTLGLVSPYDHPNFYRDLSMHSPECQIELVGEHHFRTTERNTMTWGCHSSLIKDHRDILERHGYIDGPVWSDLRNEGHLLWVPIPSFATHMVESCLAPSIDWEERWSTLNTQ